MQSAWSLHRAQFFFFTFSFNPQVWKRANTSIFYGYAFPILPLGCKVLRNLHRAPIAVFTPVFPLNELRFSPSPFLKLPAPPLSSLMRLFTPPVGEEGDDEEGGEENLPSCMDYVMHFITVFWKVLFAFVPPTGKNSLRHPFLPWSLFL